jgi:hypothetical protein
MGSVLATHHNNARAHRIIVLQTRVASEIAMTRAWGGQWNAEHELRRAQGLRTTILSDWHPWFAWYPVKPFIICGPNKYPEITGVKMAVGPRIWLRRCWRRRLRSDRVDLISDLYEYRRWK